MHQVKTIVEIGTLAGYSTLWMARALPKDGHIITLNKEPAHIAMARENFAQADVKDRIEMLEGDARDSLEKLAAEGRFAHTPLDMTKAPLDMTKAPLDMIFIDADKIGYNTYLDWAEQHVRKGGLIVADNTFLFDTVWLDKAPEGTAPTTWAGMRRFNERLADSSRYLSVIVPTQEGVTIAIKNF